MELLRLAALDEDDLSIISAHMQDAILRVGDMCWQPRRARFALVANRFEWFTHKSRPHEAPTRARTGLHFDHVRGVKYRNIRMDDPDGLLSLLAITFTPGPEPPGGFVDLVFSGDGIVRLEVECIDAWLRDFGECWQAGSIPSHDIDEDDA